MSQFYSGNDPQEASSGNTPGPDFSVRLSAPSDGSGSPAGKTQKNSATTSTFRLKGVDCGDCAAKLSRKLTGLSGVEEASLNFGAAILTVRHTCPVKEILKMVRVSGYDIEPEGNAAGIESTPVYKNKKVVLTSLTGLFLVTGFFMSLTGLPERFSIIMYLLAIITGGFPIAKNVLSALRSGSLDMNSLMVIAVTGAAAIGEWAEGATVVFLFTLGSALQSYTLDKTRNSIKTLIGLSPKEALVRRDGSEFDLPTDQVRPGDILLVRPGERIALDGEVLCGSSGVDQSPVTGESIPVEKNTGDRIYAGSLNGRGFLEVKVTKAVQDSTLARITRLVEEAQDQRAPSQQFVDVFARYYTPAVIIAAVLTAAIPPLALGQPFTPWFERALILLVISCPCALVISTPVSIVSAIGSAAKRGVLIKGGVYLEEAGALKVVAFDKTGTLTGGRPEVTGLLPAPGYNENDLLTTAASIENCSEHHLAAAVLELARLRNIQPAPCAGFRSFPGRGAAAEVGGQTCYAGNVKLFEEAGISTDNFKYSLTLLEQDGKTPIIIGSATGIIGIIAVADRVKDHAAGAVAELRRSGVNKIVMLTGDSPGAASAVAARAGVDEYLAGLLPEDKLRVVSELKEKYGKVAMVGDGINDAPALAASTVGIAMGAAGTDTALETADVALMTDDLGRLPYLIRLGRKTLAIIRQNVAFSILVKGAFIVATMAGVANLWMAVFADTGAALLVILNGMRLLRAGDEPKTKRTTAAAPCTAACGGT